MVDREGIPRERRTLADGAVYPLHLTPHGNPPRANDADVSPDAVPPRGKKSGGDPHGALQRLDRTVAPKLARQTFDRWMQDAGIPRVRRKRYLGHGKRDVTDDYEWYEVVAYLREDAGKMRALLPQQGMRVVPGGKTS